MFFDSLKKCPCYPEIFCKNGDSGLISKFVRDSTIGTVFGVLGVQGSSSFGLKDNIMVFKFGDGGSASRKMRGKPLVVQV